MLVDCGSLGLFLGVSASNSTGASLLSSLAHDGRPLCTTFNHILRLNCLLSTINLGVGASR